MPLVSKFSTISELFISVSKHFQGSDKNAFLRKVKEIMKGLNMIIFISKLNRLLWD